MKSMRLPQRFVRSPEEKRMEVEALNLPVIFLIQPRVINDESGYFVRTVNKRNLAGQ
jgi:dTDP-4-dehydrorhamnose 3,5-epimerase-like enzyme